jgi:hypothetical protein
VLVFIEHAPTSIRVTGRLEAALLGTLRCGVLSEANRILREAGSVLGAALIDAQTSDGEAVLRAVQQARPDLPLIVRTGTSPGEPWQVAGGPSTEFARRVVGVLNR